MVAPVFESVYKTEKFLSCFFSDLWTIFIDIVYVISHFHFLQIRVQAINTLAFIFDLLIFEGNHLENKKYRFFLRKCLSISLKMKPFSKLTSHRLCQQPKCPQTSAGLAQSVDRQHCGDRWFEHRDRTYIQGLLKISQKGRYCFCSAVLSPLQDVKIVPLISSLALNTLTLNVRFLKVIPRLFSACDQALKAGMGETFFLAR